MTLVCFASFKGSPGVTVTALATAAVWPAADGRRKLLLEADPDGGILGLQYRMPARPGLITLAAAARRTKDTAQLWEHAQLLPGGLPVVFGPDGPEQASEVLRGHGGQLGGWLHALPDVDVIADVGRLSLGSPAHALVAEADVVLGVARPEAMYLQPSSQRLLALADAGKRVGWVLVGERPYTARDVVDAYGIPVVQVLEYDERAARLLWSGASPAKLRRSPLVRSVRHLAERLAASVATSPGAVGIPGPASAGAADPASPIGHPGAPIPSGAPLVPPPPSPGPAAPPPPPPPRSSPPHPSPPSPQSSPVAAPPPLESPPPGDHGSAAEHRSPASGSGADPSQPPHRPARPDPVVTLSTPVAPAADHTNGSTAGQARPDAAEPNPAQPNPAEPDPATASVSGSPPESAPVRSTVAVPSPEPADGGWAAPDADHANDGPAAGPSPAILAARRLVPSEPDEGAGR